MASSAVSSVLYLRDVAGNHAETRTGAYIYYGDAASFHEWGFRTRLHIAGKTGDTTLKQCQKSMTDCVRHKKLASVICAKLSMEDHVVRHVDQPHARNGFSLD